MPVERDTLSVEQPLTLEWLERRGVVNTERALQNLRSIARTDLARTFPLLSTQLGIALFRLSDPDLALNSLDRFFQAARTPPNLDRTLCARSRGAQHAAANLCRQPAPGDLLVHEPEGYALLRQSHGEPLSREALVEEISAEVLRLADPRDVPAVLRRYKRRETLRIGYSDMIRGLRLETVTKQISYLPKR